MEKEQSLGVVAEASGYILLMLMGERVTMKLLLFETAKYIDCESL